MYDYDHDAPEPSLPEPPMDEPPTLAQVRAFLADKSRDGHTDAIREIIARHGSNKLSEVDPAEYASILAEAEALE